MKTYNKLVRDRIPEIIEADGKSYTCRVLDESEYQKELDKKMQEELTEFLKSGEVEELADLEEVLRAILDAKSVSYENFERMRQEKAEKRGAFKNKVLLVSVDDE